MESVTKLNRVNFRFGLAIILFATFVALQFTQNHSAASRVGLGWQHDGRLHVFFHPQCPHCHEAITFLKTQPGIAYDLHDVSEPANQTLLFQFAEQQGLTPDEIGVPLFVRGNRYLIGFGSAETTGRELIELAADAGTGATKRAAAPSIHIPLLGDIDPSQYSLLALTAVMGLSDGFNPCAMWVLIYLISLIAGIHDQRKIWWLVGTFVLASGVLYFLFMTAWLNAFLLVGYVRTLTQAIALLAIGFGISHLFELAVNRGVIACEVGNLEQRQRTMQWARDVITAPIGAGSLLLVIGLAFTVNSIEFFCSAALPAVYTHVLALTELSVPLYYAYIALYVTFFMLDDLVIFSLAVFAVQRVIDTRYAAVSRAAAGVVLVGLGLWMLAA